MLLVEPECREIAGVESSRICHGEWFRGASRTERGAAEQFRDPTCVSWNVIAVDLMSHRLIRYRDRGFSIQRIWTDEGRCEVLAQHRSDGTGHNIKKTLGKRADVTEQFWFCIRFGCGIPEVDAQGVVFNAHCLTYFDTAITEYLRALGYDQFASSQAKAASTPMSSNPSSNTRCRLFLIKSSRSARERRGLAIRA